MLDKKDAKFLEDILPIWPQLSKSQKDVLIENAQMKHFEAHRTIHGKDDDCLGVLVVTKGKLRVYMLSEEGREITLYYLEDNDVCVLSASCILTTISFDVFIDAEVETNGILIDMKAFSKVMDENIYLENFVYKETTERFSDVMWAMQQVLFTSLDKRLAIYLVDQMNQSKSQCIEVTHETLAKYIGSAREVVSRMLKYFEKEGIVELYRGGILIKDKEKLKNLVK